MAGFGTIDPFFHLGWQSRFPICDLSVAYPAVDFYRSVCCDGLFYRIESLWLYSSGVFTLVAVKRRRAPENSNPVVDGITMIDISKKLVAIAKKMRVNFLFKERSIPLEEVFAETGLLPGLTKRANQLASLCLGYGLGATFEETEGSLLGNKVIFDDFTPDVLRLLCIVDVVNELIKNSANRELVTLDELMYD